MDTKIVVAGKIARSWVILTQYQSVDGLLAVKVLVDVWGPKLFADVTVIQTFKGGGGQQFGGKKATHQHSGAEREKSDFLSMKFDNLNVDVGHLFCFGEQINEDLKPLEPTRDQTPIQSLLHACSTIGLQHKMPKLDTPTKKDLCKPSYTYTLHFWQPLFIYCEHLALSNIQSNRKNWFFEWKLLVVTELSYQSLIHHH